MDDSMDAFVSTLHHSRPVTLSRKRKVNVKSNSKETTTGTNQDISKQSPNIKENVEANERHTVAQLSAENNDTLFDLEELDHDDPLQYHCGGESNEKTCKTDKGAVSSSGCGQDNKRCLNNENRSDGIVCSLCDTFVLKKDCRLHHVKCLNEKFNLKTTNQRSEDAIPCRTCGKSVNTDEFPKHSEECDKANFDIARKISLEKVTSSYFSARSKISRCNCPTCGKDISHLNSPSRHRHANLCLDKQSNLSHRVTGDLSPHPTSVSSESKTTLCKECNKTFKSSRGLNSHLRSCKAMSSAAERPKRKRKVRSPKSADEDILQLALGISASTSAAAKQRIKEEKRRKKEIPIPAVLQMSVTSRQKALESRVNSIISTSGSVPNGEVPSTPVLPTSNKQKEDGEVPRPTAAPCSDNSTFSPNEAKENCLTDKECPSEKPPMRFNRRTSASKWSLTADAPSGCNFRVAGLLSQFDGISNIPSPPAREEEQADATSADVVDASADVNLPSIESIPSTLLNLVNLHKPPHPPSDDDESLPGDPPLKRSVEEDSTTLDDPTSHCRGTCQEPARVLEDLHKMIDDPQWSDLRVEAEGRMFHFHKFMLAARCPSLLQVLTGGCDGDGIFHASSCTIGEIHHLQLHIYTGHCRSHDTARNAALKLGSSLPLHREALTEDGKKNEKSNLDVKEDPGRSRSTCDELDHVTSNSQSVTGFLSDDDLFASFTTPSTLRTVSRSLASSARGAPENISGNLNGSAFEFPNVNTEADSLEGCDTSKDLSQGKDAVHDVLEVVAGNDAKDAKINQLKNQCISNASPVSPNLTSVTTDESVLFESEKDKVTDAKNKLEPPQSSHVEETLLREDRDASNLTSDGPFVHNVFNEDFFFESRSANPPQDSDSDLEVYDVAAMDCDVDAGGTSRRPLSQPVKRVGDPSDEDNALMGKSQHNPSTDDLPNEDNQIPSNELEFSVNDSVLLRGVINGLEEGASSKTPRRTKNDLVPITPMPNFSDMDTPDIIQKGRGIGLKKTLGKKKMKIKLKEYHAYTHQVESDEETPSTPPAPPPGERHERRSVFGVLHCLNDDTDGSESDEPERPRDDSREAERSATRALEKLSNSEFEASISRALHHLHRKGSLVSALKRDAKENRGVPRGSLLDMGGLMLNFTPDSGRYVKEWTILLDLSPSKRDGIVDVLSRAVVEIPGLSQYQPHLFNVLPAIYRRMLKDNPQLRPTRLGVDAEL